jgi:hypothetical protein
MPAWLTHVCTGGMMFRHAAIGLLMAGVFAVALTAQEQVPSVMAGILTRDGIGARAIGLGTAFTAVADDTTAGYYNPAGLSAVDGVRTGGMYESKFAFDSGTSYQFLSGTYRLETIGLGTSVTLVQRSDRNIPTQGGYFDASETLLLVSGGWDLWQAIDGNGLDELSIGASMKFYGASGHDTARARGTGVDIGALARLAIGEIDLALGFRSSDVLGSTIRWMGTLHEVVETVPWGHNLGVSVGFDTPEILVAADVSVYPSQPELNTFKAGLEYSLFGLDIRAGIDGTTLVLGLGVVPLEWLRVDLAVVLHQDLGQSVVASTEIKL